MKIFYIKYFPFDLLFKKTYKTSFTQNKLRKTFYLEILDDKDDKFYGEAAPLPDFGSESFEDVENELKNISGVVDIEFNGSINEIKKIVNNIATLPTVKSALEGALLSHAIYNKKDILKQLGLTSRKEINVNGIVGLGDYREVYNSVKKLVNEGFYTVKLKIGRKGFEEDLQIVSNITRSFKNQIKLRLDVNCAWNLDTAKENLAKLKNFPIEYIEQPVKDIKDLIKLSSESEIPIAADESVRCFKDALRLIDDSNVKYLVLKPMFLGGLLKTKMIIDRGVQKGIQSIVSSSLESNIARTQLILTAALTDNNLAHGLATSDLFSNNLIEDPYPVENGKIKFSQAEIKLIKDLL